MLSFDPGALAAAFLGAAKNGADGPDWTSPHSEFAGLNALIRARFASPATSPHSQLVVSGDEAVLNAALEPYHVKPQFSRLRDRTGILTITNQAVTLPFGTTVFSVKGGDKPVLARTSAGKPTNSALPQTRTNYMFVVPLDRQPVPIPTATRPLAYVPDGKGRLWFMDGLREASTARLLTAASTALTAYEDARRQLQGVGRPVIYSNLVFPWFTVNECRPIPWASGATSGPVEVAHAYQVVHIGIETAKLPAANAPIADPEGPQPLVFNGPTLVFRTDDGNRLQWVAQVTASDWNTL